MKYFSVAIFLLLVACATPQYRVPRVEADQASAAELQLLQQAYDTALARRARVYDLAWPVLTQNAELCERARPSIGVVLADRELTAKMAAGLREDDMERIGIPDSVRLLHVMKGSPAEEVGLQVGDELVRVEEEDVENPSEAGKRIRKLLKEEKEVHLAVLRDDQEMHVTVHSVSVCDMAVKISTSQSINASAADGDIVIHTGLIRAMSDEALQFVIAHEAAHIMLHHPRKYWRNLTVTGTFITGPIVYGSAMIMDGALGMIGRPTDVALTTRSLHLLAPWAKTFEAEADYVGLYMFARAGGDISAAQEVFETFSREHPKSIFAKSTHPVTPDRLVAFEATRAEIENNLKAGEALEPVKKAAP